MSISNSTFVLRLLTAQELSLCVQRVHTQLVYLTLLEGASTFGTFHNKAVVLQLSSRDATFEYAYLRDKQLCQSIKNGDYPNSVGSISQSYLFWSENCHHGPSKQDYQPFGCWVQLTFLLTFQYLHSNQWKQVLIKIALLRGY